jgi:hypothetical protein
MRMRPALLICVLGVLTFGLVFASLEFSPSSAEAPAPEPTLPADTPTPTVIAAADSVAPKIAPGDDALGVPIGGSEALLRDVQPGDRLDIVVSLAPARDAPPVTTVLVRGATVLKPQTPTDPMLIETDAPDAVMLAHVVMSGTRLGYILWPSAGTPPPLDPATSRDALNFGSPTPVPATPTPLAAPTASPVPATNQPTLIPGPGSGFLYQVQSNDTWDTIASTFGISVSTLRQWNEASGKAEPNPGSLVFIPRSS